MGQAVFTKEDWQKREGRYWSTFFNTLSGPRSVVMIGTENDQGIGNLGLFNSLVHIGANPPLLGFILRPTSVSRHTYENIQSSGFYTVNHVHPKIVDEAHQTSAKYDAEADEFDQIGLCKEHIGDFQAPFVEESSLKMGLEFREELLIKANETRLVIGEIKLVSVPDDITDDDGFVDTAKAQTILTSGLDAYHKHELLERKPYARP